MVTVAREDGSFEELVDEEVVMPGVVMPEDDPAVCFTKEAPKFRVITSPTASRWSAFEARSDFSISSS